MCNLKVNIYVLETYFTFILFLWSIHAFNLFRNLLYIVVALWRGIPCTFLTKVHTESRLQNKAGIYRYKYCKQTSLKTEIYLMILKKVTNTWNFL